MVALIRAFVLFGFLATAAFADHWQTEAARAGATDTEVLVFGAIAFLATVFAGMGAMAWFVRDRP